MSNLPISSKYRSRPETPVSEAERNDLTTRLNESFTRGEVSQDDYRVLLDQLYAARNYADLVPVVEQAGVKQTHAEPDIVRTGALTAPGEVNLPARNPNRLAGYAVLGAGVLAVLVALLLLLVL